MARPGHITTAETAILRFAECLIGKQAFNIEHHWNVMHRFSYFQGLAINAAISAIDIALRNIKGKALSVPIYQLLEAPCRTKARVYGHIYENTIEKVLEECKRKMSLWFTAFGHLNSFLMKVSMKYISKRTSRRYVTLKKICARYTPWLATRSTFLANYTGA